MEANASTSEVGEPVSPAQTIGAEPGPPNALALEYLSEPSSSSIAMMRNAFRGLLDDSGASPTPLLMEQEGL
jgi:hypothetical protein